MEPQDELRLIGQIGALAHSLSLIADEMREIHTAIDALVRSTDSIADGIRYLAQR